MHVPGAVPSIVASVFLSSVLAAEPPLADPGAPSLPAKAAKRREAKATTPVEDNKGREPAPEPADIEPVGEKVAPRNAEVTPGAKPDRAARQAARGLVKDQGRYVIPQQKLRREQSAADRQIRQEFFRRVKRQLALIRGGSEVERATARKDLISLRDPLAVDALMSVLADKGSVSERKLLVESLAEIDGPESGGALLELAMADDDQSVRWAATDALKPRKSPGLVQAVAVNLRHASNARVNRAADVLAELREPNVAPALIDALSTRHRYTRPPTQAEIARAMAGSIQAIGPAPASGGQSAAPGLAPGVQAFGVSTPPREVTVVEERQNPQVRAALVELTGQDLGYDRDRWRDWLRRRVKPTSGAVKAE